ncbi:MAG: hypothetical protein WAN47_04450 [Nitrosotalea sp.]
MAGRFVNLVAHPKDFLPFYNHQIIFPNQDWIYFEIAAIVGFVTILTTRKSQRIQASA